MTVLEKFGQKLAIFYEILTLNIVIFTFFKESKAFFHFCEFGPFNFFGLGKPFVN